MSRIIDVHAWEVLDSIINRRLKLKHIQNVEILVVRLFLVEHQQAVKIDKSRYIGKGVLKSVENVNEVLSKVVIAIDVAASEFYNNETKKYELKKSNGGEKTTSEMIDWLEELVNKYPIISIEDGLSEDDWDGAN